jgi:RND family efflux transporter MFP subunit
MTSNRMLWARRLIKPVAGVAAIAGLMLFSIGGCSGRIPPDPVAHKPGVPLPEGARTHTLRMEPVPSRLEIAGTVASEEQIQISARIPGHVARVHVSAGDRVEAEQVLVELDDRELREQQTSAEAALKQAESEFRRTEELFKRQAATEQARTAAEAQFHAARAQVERVNVMRSYARVTTPIAGIVSERRVEAGDLANPGQVLARVYDPGRMRLEVPVPVRWIEHVALGQEVEIELDRPAGVRRGTVSEILGELDPVSRTQMMRVRIGEAGGALPGTFGRLWIPGAERPTLRVPESAVQRVGQLEFVRVVRDGRALRRTVRTGPRRDGVVEILSGLSEGDVVWLDAAGEG